MRRSIGKSTRDVISSIGLAFVLSVQANPAFACACCADAGVREIYTYEGADNIATDLQDLTLGATAHVYTTACGLECAEGIVEPQDQYDVAFQVSDGKAQLTFTSQTASGGSIQFDIPKQITEFLVDTTPDPKVYSPVLYKEYRMQVSATGTGAFAALLPDMTTSFLLQGDGNLCTSMDNYKNWRLHAKGNGVDFSLFGSLLPE